MAYWTAYLKANYPAEYMAALLTSVGDDKDRMALYLAEARRMGVKVLPPDVSESQQEFAAVGDDVRFGLGAIRNVGTSVVQGILEARRGGAFGSFIEFLSASPPQVCNKRALGSLVKAGAFDSFGYTRRALFEVHEKAASVAAGLKRAEGAGQFDLFGELDDEPSSLEVGLKVDPAAPEWPQDVLLGFEREMLGLYVSAHPLDHARAALEKSRSHSIAGLLSEPQDGIRVTLAGLITNVERRISKKSGQPWAKVTLEDTEASIEVLIFSKHLPLVDPLLVPDAVVEIVGRVSAEDESAVVFGHEVYELDVPDSSGPQPVVITLREERATAALIAELKDILRSHPGEAPVHMHLMRPSQPTSVLLALEPFAVNPSANLRGDLKALLGPTAVS